MSWLNLPTVPGLYLVAGPLGYLKVQEYDGSYLEPDGAYKFFGPIPDPWK